MIGTLQRYVACELLKTFALTAVGLTLTFSLCGGVFNMIQAEVLTAIQLARMLGFVLPIATTLTLPIAALFACAMVYGRLAADNEFNACRASGLNIHRLLAPAVALSIFTAGFTYGFTNHLIPKFIEQLDAMVRRDIQQVVVQALGTRGYIKYRDYVLYAGRTQLDDAKGDIKTVHIADAAFLEMEDGMLARCGTAHSARVDFHRDMQSSSPSVQATLYGIRWLDINRSEVFETQVQPFDPMQLPSKVRLEPKWLTLPQLFYYQQRPLELPTIEDQIAKLHWLVREAQYCRNMAEQLRGPEGKFVLADQRVRYEVRAGRVEQDSDSLRPTLYDVTIEETAEGIKRHYEAPACKVDVTRSGLGTETAGVQLSLRGEVVMIDATAPDTRIDRKRWELERIALPDELPELPTVPDTEILFGQVTDSVTAREALVPLGLGTRVEDARESIRREIVKVGLEITGIIHSRLAFSASSLVILLLAAALGIIFRGGQLLTAFVISFAPGLLVVVMNIMGRQLSENTGTHLVGISVIWAGIALLVIADVVVIFRYLRR